MVGRVGRGGEGRCGEGGEEEGGGKRTEAGSIICTFACVDNIWLLKGLASYCQAKTILPFSFLYFNIVKCFLKH